MLKHTEASVQYFDEFLEINEILSHAFHNKHDILVSEKLIWDIKINKILMQWNNVY